MGSRVMHLIIADQVTKNYPINNKQAFLLGGIAPDAVSPKELSHFFAGDLEKYTRRIAYENFPKKYDLNSDYLLGYYSHLIADDLWHQGFYMPWLKNRMEVDKSIFEKYHRDFFLLNGKLANYYDFPHDILDGCESIAIPNLEEVKASNVTEFIPYVKGDLDYNQSSLEEELQVFTLEQMIGYVETSVDKSIVLMKELDMESSNDNH